MICRPYAVAAEGWKTSVICEVKYSLNHYKGHGDQTFPSAHHVDEALYIMLHLNAIKHVRIARLRNAKEGT